MYPVLNIWYPVFWCLVSYNFYPYPVNCIIFLEPDYHVILLYPASCIMCIFCTLFPFSCILYPIPVSCFNYLHGESSVVRAGTERLYFSRKFSRTWNNIKIIKKLIFNNKQTNFVINNSFFYGNIFIDLQ